MADQTEREAIYQAVEEKFKELRDAEKTSDGSPQPLTLKINGSEYKFKDQGELESALGQTFTTFNNELTTRDRKIAESVTPARREGEYTSGKEGETREGHFSQEEYIKLMGEDILKANDYLLNHQIFGGKVPNAAQAIKEKLGEVERSNATISVYQFKELHPEFPMTEQATRVIDGLRRELGQGFTLQGLEAAYGVAQTRGLLPSPQLLAYQRKQEEDARKSQETQPEQLDLPLGFQAPPRVARTSAAPAPDFMSQAEGMDLTELTKVLKKAGML